jgi:hypothetical protein
MNLQERVAANEVKTDLVLKLVSGNVVINLVSLFLIFRHMGGL